MPRLYSIESDFTLFAKPPALITTEFQTEKHAVARARVSFVRSFHGETLLGMKNQYKMACLAARSSDHTGRFSARVKIQALRPSKTNQTDKKIVIIN